MNEPTAFCQICGEPLSQSEIEDEDLFCRSCVLTDTLPLRRRTTKFDADNDDLGPEELP